MVKNNIRTVIRCTRHLNVKKLTVIHKTVEAYAKEKDKFLVELAHLKNIPVLRGYDKINELVKSEYESKYLTKARLWKAALIDAQHTMVMMWEASMKGKEWTLKNIRKYATRPRVNIARSMLLDSCMYRVFDENGTQYISVMTNNKPVVIPLMGHSKISGNIRLVLDDNDIKIHVSQDVQEHSALTGNEIAIDTGVTELFVDSDGEFHYDGFGNDCVTEPNKNRSKLWSIYKKTGNPNIKKYNLGTKKKNEKLRKKKVTIQSRMNHTINTFIDEKQPSAIGMENLSNYRPKKYTRSKKMNNKLSNWARGVFTERLGFKAETRGSRFVSLNPAYSSRICSQCGYVDAKNRNGDVFKCLNCGHDAHADVEAALELKRRMNDHNITQWTKKSEVLELLKRRFETRKGTVPGKTIDMATSLKPYRRAKQKKDLLSGTVLNDKQGM